MKGTDGVDGGFSERIGETLKRAERNGGGGTKPSQPVTMLLGRREVAVGVVLYVLHRSSDYNTYIFSGPF